MRQQQVNMFHKLLKDTNLIDLDVADFGGQDIVVLVQNSNKRNNGAPNPFGNIFKSYCKYNLNVKLNPDRQLDLTQPLPEEDRNKFDLVISFDTLEHVKYPHKLCENMVAAAKPSGLVYLSTLFAWPYHSSKDYFRFSPDALKVCFEGLLIDIILCGWDEDSTYLKKQTGVFYFGKKK